MFGFAFWHKDLDMLWWIAVLFIGLFIYLIYISNIDILCYTFLYPYLFYFAQFVAKNCQHFDGSQGRP